MMMMHAKAHPTGTRDRRGFRSAPARALGNNQKFAKVGMEMAISAPRGYLF
jgi:hypothetical protein